MTDRMKKLLELDNEINKLLKENEKEVEKEEKRYKKEFEDAYIEMAESLRPYHDLYVKTDRMMNYTRNRFVINEKGWNIVFHPYLGFVVTDEPHNTIIGRCCVGWSKGNEYCYLIPELAYEKYFNSSSFRELLNNWDAWFYTFENSFIDKYHESKAIDIEIANKDLEWRKSLKMED